MLNSDSVSFRREPFLLTIFAPNMLEIEALTIATLPASSSTTRLEVPLSEMLEIFGRLLLSILILERRERIFSASNKLGSGRVKSGSPTNSVRSWLAERSPSASACT